MGTEGSGLCLPNIPAIAYAVAQHRDGGRIFFQDGDALVYPFPVLKDSWEAPSRKGKDDRRVELRPNKKRIHYA